MMDFENRHLKQKNGHWHYQRRIPTRYARFDDRRVVEVSLRTQTLDTARQRRDALEEGDDLFWASLAGIDGEAQSADLIVRQRDVAQRRYKAAKVRSLERLYLCACRCDLAETVGLDEIVERLRVVESVGAGKSGAVHFL